MSGRNPCCWCWSSSRCTRVVLAVVGGVERVVVNAVAPLEHGLVAELVDRRDPRHPHRLRSPDPAILAGIARVDRTAPHAGNRRRQLRDRIPGVGRLGEIGDRQLRIRIEIDDHLIRCPPNPVLPLDPETEVDRQVVQPPGVLPVGREEMVAQVARRLDGRQRRGRNAEHERREAQPEVARRQLRGIARLAGELVGERQLPGRIPAQAPLTLRQPGVHARPASCARREPGSG